MTTFNTGNPVGSVDPRDLYDNAENFDTAINDVTSEEWSDRLGRPRKTWHGVVQQAYRQISDIAENAGYQFVGDYAAGIEITGYNQIVRDENGEFWRLSGNIQLPYTTTGAGLPEDGAFVAIGDATLRSELSSSDEDLGASLVGYGDTTVKDQLDIDDNRITAVGNQYSVEEFPVLSFDGTCVQSLPNNNNVVVINSVARATVGRYTAGGSAVTDASEAVVVNGGLAGIQFQSGPGYNNLIEYDSFGINGNNGFTFRARLSVTGTNEPAIFSQVNGDSNFVLFYRASDISIFTVQSGFITLADGDFRDGITHEIVLSIDPVGYVVFSIDGQNMFSRFINNAFSLYGLRGESLLVGGYPTGADRYVNAVIYELDMWNSSCDDFSAAALFDAGKLKHAPFVGYVRNGEIEPGVGAYPELEGSYRNKEWIDLYFIFGQSNAAGRGSMDSITAPAPADRQLSDLRDHDFSNYYIYNNSEFQKIILGENQNAGGDGTVNQIGPEIGLSYMAPNKFRKSAIVKVASGGRSLYEEWNPNTGSEGWLWQNAVNAINASIDYLESRGYVPRCAGMFWMQGERDAKGDLGGGPSNYYADYLETLITRVREIATNKIEDAYFSSGVPVAAKQCSSLMPVVIGRIKIGDSLSEEYPEVQQVWDAQDVVAGAVSNVSILNTAHLAQNSDDLHFSSGGQLDLGRTFYKKLHGVN